jgi:drug/metabolite transporter (DMT)-like permease
MLSPRLSGVGLRLLATFLMTAMSAAVHAVAGQVPVGQIIFWRSAVAILPILLYAAARGGVGQAFRTRRPGAHLTRSLFGALSMALSFLSLAYLPVATAQGLAYLAPVLTLPFAAAMLGERMRAGIVLPVLLGLIGTGFIFGAAMAMPGEGATIGVAAALGYALTMAFVRVHIKGMTGTETASAIAFYFALTSALVGLATLPFGWATPDPATLALLILAGLLGGIGHIVATEATARAPISVLAAFDYTGLIWALGFDILLFHLWPDAREFAGAALILIAALWVTWPRRAPE